MFGGRVTVPASSSVATVAIIDNDTVGVLASPTFSSVFTITEETTKAYTVRLNSQPTNDVSIGIASDNLDVTVDQASLTFTSVNWSEPQTIIVTAAQDFDAVNDDALLTHVASGGGGEITYEGITEVLTVEVEDPDIAAILFSDALNDISSLNVDEGSSDISYLVFLDTQPTADVSIAIANVGDVSVRPPTLDFTTSNWGSPQR